MGKKEIKKRVKLEMAHQQFIADRNNVPVVLSPMAMAFAGAIQKGK